ncbi:pesticidal protein [Bacillus thuringiensis serovar roskildiensis]|uniref:Crystaline entomocidal protoxin n=2 Tax=Bacillus thuringiensis TaxID=1428 RepID=A0A9Q5SL94_BACTU|nr:insecticidal delta-endotoxin Cry8Ea1 family protein [Bacillus thuringiensis]ABB70817.1 insecticidal crystal protein Cry7Ba1 [Bacillus thuringiensis serovar huazhongensis]MEB9661375.1 insecticidal delta-endotoxin Cry8Ea1 family protein [Bacillus cereus]ARV91367.1 pesticidal protein [Bacillus thuringiensis]OTW70710.1 pesticidal protein [Bacillus thuringiensis serovar coreanensis]OTX53145.1 pesticidal protein [Bacillus thuringiensis serovar sooncheon]
MDIRNQNKYEVVYPAINETTSNTTSKYPLASDPIKQYQNMNYKDSLNIIEGNNVITPVSGTAVLATARKIGGKIVKAIGEQILSKILKEILDYLWPSSSSSNSWEEMMKEVEYLIDKKIEEYARNKALAVLEGIGNAVESYYSALEAWELESSERSLELVLERYQFAVQFARSSMPSFAIINYEIPLLATYANAANVHLLLMRDIQIYGDRWGISQNDMNLFLKEQEIYTSEYSEHCVKWYNEGLNQLKTKGGASGLVWENYNSFRTEMTIMVLDLVAIFPAYNMSKYPIESTVELTRTIYTDPLGYTGYSNDEHPTYYSSAKPFSSIESRAVLAPSLFKWITQLEVYTKKYSYSSQYTTLWTGLRVIAQPTKDFTDTVYDYGSSSGSENKDVFDLYGNDVYDTQSVVSSYKPTGGGHFGVPQFRLFWITKSNGLREQIFNYANNMGSYSAYRFSKDELPIELLQPPLFGDIEEYSHRLSHVSEVIKDYGEGIIPVLGWTHVSVTRDNRIYPDKITQLPAVKMYELLSSAVVVKGPGFTGGDLVKRTGNGGIGHFNVSVESPGTQRYRLRIRYSSEVSGVFHMQINDIETIQGEFSSTADSTSTLSSEAFQLREYSTTFTFPTNMTKIKVSLGAIEGAGGFYLDRIEFIPVDENHDNRVTLEKAQKAVNALFTAGRNALQTDVTDYKVDQVSILVDCVSGELYPNEKRELLSLVKYAKRLSYSRNLLLDPTFDSINSSDENGWYGSNGIAIGNGNFVFKGNYLIFSGTNDTQYPTYLYQKIDESKLKEYTRYKLRGFIENSQDLEAYVIRYDAKHETLDVSNNLLPDISPVNACGEPNRCAALQYLDENPRLECSSIQDGILSDSHSFSLNIDTGSIDFNENVGIWVLFKISTPEGYAKFGNLEVIEDSPVIGEALARVKRQETKWRNKLTQLRTETQAIYTRAKQAIDNVFTNAQDSHLKIGTTFAAIVAARKIVQSIREAYMSWLSIVPGVNYPIFTELNERVQRAFQLYDVRNVVRNGRFLNGVSDWIVTSDVKVQEENGNNVLVLSNWDAQVLQCLKLYQDRGYILRVTARKEGLGEGYITITDEEGHTDQLTFGTCEEIDASNTFVTTGYITKELEFFPDTEKVRIEIGETEGTFQVESIELFLMEDLC